MSKYIEIGTMYRDGCNYKQHSSTIFENDLGLSVDEIEKKINETIKFDEPILAEDYHLENCAAVKSEYDLPHNDYDHCYIEVTSVEPYGPQDTLHPVDPISLFVGALDKPDEHSKSPERRNKSIGNALDHMANTLELNLRNEAFLKVIHVKDCQSFLGDPEFKKVAIRIKYDYRAVPLKWLHEKGLL